MAFVSILKIHNISYISASIQDIGFKELKKPCHVIPLSYDILFMILDYILLEILAQMLPLPPLFYKNLEFSEKYGNITEVLVNVN